MSDQPMRTDVIAEAARLLYDARANSAPIDLLTARWPDLTIAEAEAIALATVDMYEAPIVGFKLGFTSAVMRKQMNISAPNFGCLTADMDVSNQKEKCGFIHPRIEPEIALVVGKRIEGGPLAKDQLRAYIASVHPALEIVDTRYHEYKFLQADNTADNSSAAGFVLGPAFSADAALDLAVPVNVKQQGRIIATGKSSDVMGGPLDAFAWLVPELARRAIPIPAGAIILTGGLTSALPLKRGESMTADFAGMGQVSYRWE